MPDSLIYRLAADAVLLLHVAVVVFVIAGLLLIVWGWLLRWVWIRNLWFRLAHLLAILVVALQAWLGLVCPLTTLEMLLRAKAGEATYGGSFIAHWLQSLLYIDAPAWIFILCYSLFAVLVAAAWIWVPPRRYLPKNSRK